MISINFSLDKFNNKKTMTKQIYQIKIVLQDFKPGIWRRILVPSDMLLPDLHKVIQTTMGWENAHLHQFIKNGRFYTFKMDDDIYWDELDNVDYKNIRISELLSKEKERIQYEYDFGDSWTHSLILEKILPFDKSMKYPVCLKGKMNCPPEDCGGVWGYANMLEILNNPEHEEYEEFAEWLEEDFDPEHFDIDEVNEMLQSKNYGCFSFF
jgi:hypothetical protein